MRGGFIPAALLVLAAVAASWLSASRPAARWTDGWQTAGLGAAGNGVGGGGGAATPKILIELVRTFVGGGAAEAQGRDGAVTSATSDFRIERPRFSRITIEPGRTARFNGSGPAGRDVTVELNGRILGIASVDADGNWNITAPALGPGDHRLRLLIEQQVSENGGTTEGQEVRISIPEGARGAEIVAFDDSLANRVEPLDDTAVRDYAERLAREASREFDTFTQKQSVEEQPPKSAQAGRDGSENDAGDRRKDAVSSPDPLAPVTDWLSQSSRDYYDYVVPELAKKGPRQPSLTAENVPVPGRPGGDSKDLPRRPALPDFSTLANRVEVWLRDANRTYHDEIVVDLSRGGERQAERQETAQVEGGREDRRASQPEQRDGERQGALDRQAQEVARQVVEDQRAAEARPDGEQQRQADIRREQEEASRQQAIERQRRLDELLAAREAETRRAEHAARMEAARLEAQSREEERHAAERLRDDEERKAEAARRLEAVLAEEEAARARAEEEKRLRQAEAEAERERLARLESERVAREAAEDERLAAERQLREDAERRLRIARDQAAEAGRRSARIAAKSERADRVARLADEAGFGRTTQKPATGGEDEKNKSIALPDAKPDRRRGVAAMDGEDRESQAAARIDRDQVSADRAVADRAVADGSVTEKGRVGAPSLPTQRAGRGETFRSANGLGGPEVRRRGSLKDVSAASLEEDSAARLAGWRQWSVPIDTGCKDSRAGQTIQVPGTYVVARGDTLWQISWRHYRTGENYRRIYKANRRKLRNPRMIYPCQRVWLPRL